MSVSKTYEGELHLFPGTYDGDISLVQDGGSWTETPDLEEKIIEDFAITTSGAQGRFRITVERLS